VDESDTSNKHKKSDSNCSSLNRVFNQRYVPFKSGY